jgi:hypothetical protein
MTQVVDASEEAGELPRPSGGERRRGRLDPACWVAALALVLGFGFVAVSLAWNGGKLFAPLDDVYIHLQYGSQLGSGRFFQFNTGDEISAGASSMLYAFVLGAAYAIGVHGTLFLAFAVAFNVACFAASAALTCVLGTRLVHRTAGIWAGVLVAVSGPLAWGAASGMEVGLVMLLVTGLLVAFATEQPAARFRGTPVVAALLALVRPEGLIFATALTCAVWWTLWTQRRVSGTAATARRALWSLLPLALGAAQLLFYRLATGTGSANGVQAKSLLYDHPVFYPGEFADRATATLRGLFGTFLGFTSQDFTFPGALLIFCAGAAYLLSARTWRPLLIATLAGLAGAVLSLSTLNTALFHELRYFQPFFPVFLVFVVAGVSGLARLASQPRARRVALHGALAVVLAFSLVAAPMWAMRYARAGAAIRDSDVSYAAWIKGNLPPDAVVAVKDVGAVAYLSGHHIVDLLGLGTNGLAEPSNNGIGSLYEALRHLPPGQRPDYFAAYDTGPGPGMGWLRDAGVLEVPAEGTFEVKTPPDLRDILAVPFRQFTVSRADWSQAANADAVPAGGELRDYLNVADLATEKDHGYTYLAAQEGMQPWAVLGHDADVADGGRTIVGGEAFTVHNVLPGRPAVLVARAAMHGTVPELQVLVNGRPAGTWTREGQPGAWQNYTFTIPAELVTSSTLDIQLQQPRAVLSPYPDYVSYAYWLTQ